jgi:hypothetical protein
MSSKANHLTAPGNEYVRTGEACLLTGLTPKTLFKVATANKVRVRQFPSMKRGLMYHKRDLIALLAAADVGAAVRSA